MIGQLARWHHGSHRTTSFTIDVSVRASCLTGRVVSSVD